MTQMFFVDASGNYLGACDGGAAGDYWDGTKWGAAPAGVTAVPSAPVVKGQIWSNGAWADTTASLALKAQATYAALIGGGLTIQSTGTPALDATYDVSPSAEDAIAAMQTAVNTNAALFPGYWRTMVGGKVNMTAAQFTAIATAALAFVVACDDALATIAGGGTATFPSATAQIT